MLRSFCALRADKFKNQLQTGLALQDHAVVKRHKTLIIIIIILSLTVELIRRVSISSDVLVVNCLYSGIALRDSVL